MGRQFYIAMLILMGCILQPGHASAQVVLNESKFTFMKDHEFQILHDPTSTLTIDQALSAPWQPATHRAFLGLVDHAVWMRFKVTSDDATNDQWVGYIATDQAHENIDFYWLDNDQIISHQKSGSAVPFSDRNLKSRFIGTDFQLGVGRSMELLVRISSSSRVFNDFVFESRSSFQEHLEGFQLLFGFHYGLVTILAFISVVQYFSFRDQSYLAYALFCLSLQAVTIIMCGHAQLWFGGGSLPYARMVQILMPLTGVVGSFFTRLFLRTKERLPHVDKALLVMIGLGLTCSILSGVPQLRRVAQTMSDILMPINMIAMFSAGVLAVIKNVPLAKYFLASWSVFMVTIVVWILCQSDILPPSLYITPMFGQQAEMVILSLAMFERIRNLQEEHLRDEIAVKESDNLKTLVRVLSHDLANQLAIIIGWVNIGLQKPGADIKNCFKRIEVAANNQREIIEHVKTMRALVEGKISLEITPVSLREVMDQVVSTFEDALKAKGVTFNVNMKTIQGKRVMAERSSLIHSVLNNIVSNAIKFSLPGSTLTVSVADEGQRLAIVITDQGIGIPEKILVNLFSKVAPTTRPGTAGEKGTGYGMPLVKTFLQAMGGQIEVESRPKENFPKEHGTTVRLWLDKAADEKTLDHAA